MIFDVLAPDGLSILPENVRLVLQVNPKTMGREYPANVTRQATMGGYVEFDWGMSPQTISLDGVTGGFFHLYTGLIAITGPTPSSANAPFGAASLDIGGNRRQTIAYDKFLDLMALFQNNAAVYDQYGRVAYQGKIKITYHGDVLYGWFSEFSYSEAAESNMLTFTANFQVEKEVKSIRTVSRTRI
jgi:hypothetical protein